MSSPNICILDYGSGNVKSVFNILKHLGHEVVISNEKSVIKNSSHLILPGVGAFGSAMEKINNKIPLDCLEDQVLTCGKPFLGICVGMQVLADEGNEFKKTEGLGWISGSVNKLESYNLPLPHVGWNDLIVDKSSNIFDKLKDHKDFYFLHSYAFDVQNNQNILAYSDYGANFVSVVNKDNIFGFQFHPEKSQRAGQIMINNFLKQN